ncbi:response regulator [bacterium]|nr:response regulator [bacterium]
MSKGKIMVIDDEKVMCHLLTDLLKDRGYDVEYALSGKEGLAMARQKSFDVVITDIKMPKLTGLQVITKLKNIDPNTRVIIITAFGNMETAQQSLRLGAYDYITKPFDIGKISFIIKRAVASKELSLTNQKLMRQLKQNNILLEKKVKERTKQLTLLYKTGLEISSSLRLEKVLQNIVKKVSILLDLEICSILLWDSEKEELSIKCAQGLSKDVICNTIIRKGEGISGWVLEKKTPLFIKNVESDERFKKRSHEKYYTRSLISVPLSKEKNVIGVININNKKTKKPFTNDDLALLKEIAIEATIAIENATLYKKLQDTHLRTITALTAAIDAKDHYTCHHSEQVTKYATAIANKMKLSLHEIETIKRASQLHDIGKIGIPDYILTKPGKLTSNEWREVKLHPTRAKDILEPLNYLKKVIKLIKQHHERYDGKGYPGGTRAENIELGARIMAIADSFDAMTSERPYRKKFSLEKAIEELEKNKGTQFDPKIVDVFVNLLNEKPDLVTV